MTFKIQLTPFSSYHLFLKEGIWLLMKPSVILMLNLKSDSFGPKMHNSEMKSHIMAVRWRPTCGKT